MVRHIRGIGVMTYDGKTLKGNGVVMIIHIRGMGVIMIKYLRKTAGL